MFQEITLIDYRRPLSERAKARKHVGPYKWRPAQPMTGRGFYQASNGLEMDRAGSSFALRLEEANEHLRGSRLAHVNGYYCDQGPASDTLKPIIARLPHGRGFLAGWTMGEGMCASLDSHIWTDAEEAARAAHDTAERDAERAREEQETAEDEEAREDSPRYDWHDATNAETPHACVYEVGEDGAETERVADFYGPRAAERAEAYAQHLNEEGAQ